MVIMGHGLGSVRRVKRESRHLHDGSMLGMMFLQSEPFMTDTIDGSYSFDNQYRYLRGVISLLFRLLHGFHPHRTGSTLACRDIVYPLGGHKCRRPSSRIVRGPLDCNPSCVLLKDSEKNVNLDRQVVLSTQRFAQNHVSNI